MKTLITGGAGFIGSHLADLLINKGHDVTVLDNFSTGLPENLYHLGNQIKTVECDLGFEGEWQDSFKEIDWIFHMAALAEFAAAVFAASSAASAVAKLTFTSTIVVHNKTSARR